MQLDRQVESALLQQYPTLTISEIVRLSLEYTLSRKPELRSGKVELVDLCPE